MVVAQLRINGKKELQLFRMQTLQHILYQIFNLVTLLCIQLPYQMVVEI